jgi:hypothetical protein
VGVRAHPGHLDAEAQLDVQGLEVDVERRALRRTEQDRLGQRGPVVGLVGLGPEHGDRAGEAPLAEGDRRLDTGHAGADDHHAPPFCCLLLPFFHPHTLRT